jgi:hypothetical protein
MIKCWGIEFKSVQQLWEHPSCFVSTVSALRHRLKLLPPEVAVVPKSFTFLGQKFDTLYKLSQHLEESITRPTLYRRLGYILNGRKITPEQATCPGIWDRIKDAKHSGIYNTILTP